MDKATSAIPTARNRNAPKNISLVKILEYHEKGLDYSEIAKIFGCERSAIHQRLSGINKPDLDFFIKERPDVFRAKQALFLYYLTPSIIKGMLTKQPGAAALWFNSLFNNERLLAGQSTENIDIRASYEAASKVETRKKYLLEALRRKGIDPESIPDPEAESVD
jgi:hypothetical protein